MRRFITGILLVSLAMGLLWGCEGDDVTRVNLGDGGVTYDLVVQVRSWPEAEPLSGAAWTIYGSGRSGVADSLGRFTCTDLDPGWHLMRLTAPGRLPVLVSLDMEDGLGSKGLAAYRDVYLPAGTAGLRLRAVSSGDGQPLPNVPVWVDLHGLSLPGHPYHRLDPEAPPAVFHTDSLGSVLLSGLPPITVNLDVGAADADGDGELDHQPKRQAYDLSAGDTLSAVLPLRPGSGGPPRVVAASITQNRVMLGAPAWFLFEGPMDTSLVHTGVFVKRHWSSVPVPITVRWSDPRTLELVPQEVLDEVSRPYDLSLSVSDRHGGTLLYSVSRFYWLYDGPGGPPPCADPVADLRLAEPSLAVADTTTQFDLFWTPSPCATGYRVFARSQPGMDDWLTLGEAPAADGSAVVSFHCDLPAEEFDRFRADDVVTPFAGRTVQLSVVPVNASPVAPGPDHPVLTLADRVPPQIVEIFQEGSAGADGDSVLIRITFSEYMDPLGDLPELQIVEAGGDSTFAVDPGTALWRWDLDTRHGRFVIPLPPGADASGDSLYVRPGGAVDLSGNALTGAGALRLLANGAAFDFEDSPQGWSQAGDVWAWGEPTSGPGGGHDSARCWATILDGDYPSTAYGVLTSPALLVPRDAPVLTFWLWSAISYYDDSLVVHVEDLATGEIQTLQEYTTSTSGWSRQEFPLDDYAGRAIRLRFVFASDANWQAAGCFIDDVTLQ